MLMDSHTHSASSQNEYVHPFFVLQRLRCIQSLNNDNATISRAFLTALMKPIVASIRFDETFYRRTYSDLSEAEQAGHISNLHDHYVNFGFFEDRLPCHVPVDGAFYAREYPDVAVAILENRVESAQLHFESVGFREGRLPSRNWSFKTLLVG